MHPVFCNERNQVQTWLDGKPQYGCIIFEDIYNLKLEDIKMNRKIRKYIEEVFFLKNWNTFKCTIIIRLLKQGFHYPCKEWEGCLDVPIKCKNDQDRRGCTKCCNCVHRIMSSLIFVICSSDNANQNVCGRLVVLFLAKPECYTVEGMAMLRVEEHLTWQMLDCPHICEKFILHCSCTEVHLGAVKMYKNLPHIHELIEFQGCRINMVSISFQGGIGFCSFFGCDMYMTSNRYILGLVPDSFQCKNADRVQSAVRSPQCNI